MFTWTVNPRNSVGASKKLPSVKFFPAPAAGKALSSENVELAGRVAPCTNSVELFEYKYRLAVMFWDGALILVTEFFTDNVTFARDGDTTLEGPVHVMLNEAGGKIG